MPKVNRKAGNVSWNKIDLACEELAGKVGKAGWFDFSKYPDGTPIAYIASIQEFGAPEQNIPPRPFVRPAIANNQSEWRSVALKGSALVFEGKMTASQVLGVLAQSAAGAIREQIVAVRAPPLKPATIANRLRRYKDKTLLGNLDKPLVDTGQMLAAVTATVEDSPE